MNSFASIDAARAYAVDHPAATHILEIDPGQPGIGRYICTKADAATMRRSLQAKPMAEIKRVVGEAAHLAGERWAAGAAQRRKIVTIYLSGRGWGDYSPVEWTGDITRPDAEIMAECRARLEAGHDVDTPNPLDADLLAKIAEARKKWEGQPAREATKNADIERKKRTGYCWHCEGYCYGDCGASGFDDSYEGYVKREATLAHQEAAYGVEDY